ncbi:MAG: DUF4349 domain-containing protein [Allosphingosinicella sp.]
MRRLLVVLMVILAAGCGSERSSEMQRGDPVMTESADSSAPAAPPRTELEAGRASREGGPNVGPTAAPGVAFNYNYAFRLPAERIATVQEEHARACEGLGLARCRITGMRYRVVNERNVEAMLAFKLEPTIARRFGQAGVQTVARNEGMLVESEISGIDVGTSIRAAGRSIAEMTEELERLEAELARGGKSTAERQQLEYQAQQLRQSIRAQQATREEQQDSLATTPMVFRYGSGDLVPGHDPEPSFRDSARTAWENFVAGMVILFVLVVTLLPWALLALLVWWAVHLVRRRLAARRTGHPDPAAETKVSVPPVE